jgi:hypothetical protein
MSWGYRAIGLVLLLFAWSGDVAWDAGTGTECDHKVLRINDLCVTARNGGTLAQSVLPLRTPTPARASYAAAVGTPSLRIAPGLETLLSLGCLLSV